MATKVNGLIQKVNPGNNTQYSIASTAYGYCETVAATAAKVVDMTGFTLLEGTTIHVKFKNNNTAANPTLNVNGTGAKPIVQYGTTAVSTGDATTGWYAGAVVSFTYDGTSWVRDQGFNTDTDTHWTTHLYAGDGTAANKATTNGNTKISVTDNTTVRNSVTIKGTGTTSVTSDANGVITINSADSKTGTVTSITPGNGLLNGTTTNAITTSGTLNINYGTTTAKIGTAAAGSATTVSRSDHVHTIDLATGDANGQVKIAGTNVSVKGLGSNAYTSTAYLPLAGGTLINTDQVFYTANAGAQIKPNAASILQSPVPKYLWHDLWAFCRATTPKYYTSTNGTSWTEATLNKTIFSHRENISPIDILGTNLAGSRWEWIGGGYAYCFGAWLLIGVAYNSSIAKFDVLLEASSGSGDNATWTTLCNVTGVSQNSAPIWIRTTGPSDNNIRLTITRNSESAADTRLPIVALRWLTSRWGDQGKGSEWELPFTWDDNNNISPLSGGSFSGNATSASAVKDYNNNTLTKFGYSTTGMTSASWLGVWDASVSGEYRLRAITPANAIKSGIGTTAIGKASLPVYWNGSNFATITSYEGKAATAGAADTATKATQDGSGNTITSTYVKKAGDTMTGTLNIKPASGEGGELHLCASTANTNQAGIILDQLNSTFRIFGIPSADGMTKTGTGTPLVIDPYAKTITGGYTLTGSLSGNASTATKFASSQSVALTGDVTGSASSQAGWSIATTLANSGVTANTYGNTSQQTPSHGGTFNIPYFKVDVKGRVTQAGTTTVKLPADNNTDTKNTAGSTDTSSKIYLIGATSQADNPQTYSDNEVFATSGVLTAKTFNSTSLTASQAVSTDANKNLVSTNLTVSDPTASGTGITYIATISQGATGKITATKSTVRSASTSQTGVTQYTEANTNTQLSTLTTAWTATPTDDTLFIRRDTGGGATFGQVKFNTLWNYVKGKITTGTYWANIKISDAAAYNAAPEMATIKLNGNTSATAASTSNVTLVYDTTLQALNFVFA